jgi:hypothetical protein
VETPAEDPVVASTETPTPDLSAADDAAVQAALDAALAGTASAAPAAAQGPPMTGSERDAFHVAVSACWNVDVGSEAANVTVTVGFQLTLDGKVDGEVRRVSATGGSDAALAAAFQAARRAVVRCAGTAGYALPRDKFEHWRNVELTFDPSSMRLR